MPARTVAANTGRIGIVTSIRAAALFGRNRCNVIADVLPTEPHGVASAQAGVEQRVEPNTLTCADWPSPFIGSDVSLSPNRRGCWSH
jgi:hypothetical protein